MEDEAALFKVLAEPTRLRLAILLAAEGETCVCQLAEALEAPEFKISRHLGIMRSAGLVQVRRDGTWMFYSLCEPRGRLEQCLQECFGDCLADQPTPKADRHRLAASSCGPAKSPDTAEPTEKTNPVSITGV